MSQLFGPHQGASLGRRQRPESSAPPEADQGERRLPRADHHRGAHSVRGDGRVVPPGEEK